VNIVERLLIVQEHDCRIRDMAKELRDIPVRKKTEQSRLDEHTKALADAEQVLKAKQAEIQKFELEAQSMQERILKLRQQQGELKTNKEFKAMDEEIKSIQHQIKGIEDKQLGHMEELEKARTEVDAKKQSLKEEDGAVQVDVKVLDERAAAIKAQMDDAKAKRDVVAAEVPKDWLVPYERVFSRKDKALVLLEDGVCCGCHMKLPPSILHDTRKPDMKVVCSYCGRMLYWVSGGG